MEKIENKLIIVDKKPEVINCTCFDQANLKAIGKFYTIFTEKDYIKEELTTLLRKVKLKFLIF